MVSFATDYKLLTIDFHYKIDETCGLVKSASVTIGETGSQFNSIKKGTEKRTEKGTEKGTEKN